MLKQAELTEEYFSKPSTQSRQADPKNLADRDR
jgi:hypothetical protein